MPKWFTPVAVVCGLMFAVSPILINAGPSEPSMGLVSKIFYYHFPSSIMFLTAAILCGIASLRFLFGGSPHQDRVAIAAGELVVVFGLLTLVTGPLWARKAWGVWWVWDPRITSSLVLWMTGVSYLLVRKYGGPGSEKLSAGLAIFGLANAPFVYISVNYWRTIHPATTVVPTLPVDFGVPLWFSFVAFVLLFALLMRLRIRLEQQRQRVDALYLSLES